jgi:hypothetical protein
MYVCVSLWVTLVWTERVRDEREWDYLCHQKVFVSVLCGPFKSGYIIWVRKKMGGVIERKR